MTPAPVQPGSATTGATTPSNQLIGTDAFLKLLVAELSHQDPLNAMDPSQMVAQLAQLSTVDELTKVRKSSQAAMAVALLGRQVTGLDPVSGTLVQGSVAGVSLGPGEPQLVVNGTPLPLSAIRSVP